MGLPIISQRTYPVPGFLKDHVVEFWSLDANPDLSKGPLSFRLCAQAYPNLVLANGFSSLELAGGHGSHKSFSTKAAFNLLGVTVYPYALYTIFGLVPGEIMERQYSIDDLLGASGNELKDRLVNGSSIGRQLDIISAFLHERIQKFEKDDLFSKSIKFIGEFDGKAIEQLAHQCGLSRRQFERRFLRYTGFPPYLYWRLLKFRASVNKTHGYQNLTDLAYQLGYCDQSHFIREFRTFSGESPKALLTGKQVGSTLLY